MCTNGLSRSHAAGKEVSTPAVFPVSAGTSSPQSLRAVPGQRHSGCPSGPSPSWATSPRKEELLDVLQLLLTLTSEQLHNQRDLATAPTWSEKWREAKSGGESPEKGPRDPPPHSQSVSSPSLGDGVHSQGVPSLPWGG